MNKDESTLQAGARVALAAHLHDRRAPGARGFALAMQSAQQWLGGPGLMIDLEGSWVVARGERVPLPAAELAFLARFARRASEGLPSLECQKDGLPSRARANAALQEYRRIRSSIDDDGRRTCRCRDGTSEADFEQRKSKLERDRVAALGVAGARPRLMVGEGRRPMRLRLALAPEFVRLLDQCQAEAWPRSASLRVAAMQ